MRLYEQKFTYNRLIIDGIGFLFLCCLLHNCVQLCCLVCSVFRCVFSICYIIIWRRGHIISNLEFNKILSSPSERKLNIIKYTLIKIVYLEDNYSESTFTVTSKLTKHVLWQQHQPMAGSQRWRLATFVVTGKCMSSKGLHSNKPNLFYKRLSTSPRVWFTLFGFAMTCDFIEKLWMGVTVHVFGYDFLMVLHSNQHESCVPTWYSWQKTHWTYDLKSVIAFKAESLAQTLTVLLFYFQKEKKKKKYNTGNNFLTSYLYEGTKTPIHY